MDGKIQMVVQLVLHFMCHMNGPIIRKFKIYMPMVMRWHRILCRK